MASATSWTWSGSWNSAAARWTPAVALRGKQPKLSPKQQTELRRMHGSGEYTIADLAELFSVSRPTVYRSLQRRTAPTN